MRHLLRRLKLDPSRWGDIQVCAGARWGVLGTLSALGMHRGGNSAACHCTAAGRASLASDAGRPCNPYICLPPPQSINSLIKDKDAAEGSCHACKAPAAFACCKCGAAAPDSRRLRVAFQCEHGLWSALINGT